MKLKNVILFLGCLSLSAHALADEEVDVCDLEPPFWAKGEYLFWAIKKAPVHTPFVTSGSYLDPLPGAIGQPHTQVKIGKHNLGMGWFNGFQVTFGSWVNRDHWIAVEGGYFLLPRNSEKRKKHTQGQPDSHNYAVPVYDVTGVLGLSGKPGETIYLLPGPIDGNIGFQGSFRLKMTSRVQGAEANAVVRLAHFCPLPIEVLIGPRWIQVQEDLRFRVKTSTAPNYVGNPAFANTRDRFRTTDNFYGGQLGFRAEYQIGGWRFSGTLKGGMGVMNERLHINGYTTTSNGSVFIETKNTAGERLHGGIFAQKSNIGTHCRNVFSGTIEVDAHTGFRITKNVEFDMGYYFLWIAKLIRPGDQIDRHINPTRTALAEASRETVGTGTGPIPFGAPGPSPAPEGHEAPTFSFKSTDFWAQGLTVSVTKNF